MIINGGSRSNARFFASHLANGEDNESVIVCEIRNLASETIKGAFQEMEAIAMGTQCRNYFYHANLNPMSKDTLTPQQWSRAINLLEENLGLKGHARFVVEHRKKGRVHRHAIWLRIDVWRMRAVEMTDDYEKHQATSRALEREFGLEAGKSVLGPEKIKGARPARRPKPWETFRGYRSGIDVQALTDKVTALYLRSGNSQAFAEALKAEGLTLVAGDRRNFCILDRAGELHSLARRLPGITAGELAEFMKNAQPEA